MNEPESNKNAHLLIYLLHAVVGRDSNTRLLLTWTEIHRAVEQKTLQATQAVIISRHCHQSALQDEVMHDLQCTDTIEHQYNHRNRKKEMHQIQTKLLILFM